MNVRLSIMELVEKANSGLNFFDYLRQRVRAGGHMRAGNIAHCRTTDVLGDSGIVEVWRSTDSSYRGNTTFCEGGPFAKR